jgi:hypothetical protein
MLYEQLHAGSVHDKEVQLDDPFHPRLAIVNQRQEAIKRANKPVHVNVNKINLPGPVSDPPPTKAVKPVTLPHIPVATRRGRVRSYLLLVPN